MEGIIVVEVDVEVVEEDEEEEEVLDEEEVEDVEECLLIVVSPFERFEPVDSLEFEVGLPSIFAVVGEVAFADDDEDG